MAALEILYGGHTYHSTGRTLEELQREISAAASSGWSWLEVVDGGGPAHLLLSPGVSVAVIPVPPQID